MCLHHLVAQCEVNGVRIARPWQLPCLSQKACAFCAQTVIFHVARSGWHLRLRPCQALLSGAVFLSVFIHCLSHIVRIVLHAISALAHKMSLLQSEARSDSHLLPVFISSVHPARTCIKIISSSFACIRRRSAPIIRLFRLLGQFCM